VIVVLVALVVSVQAFEDIGPQKKPSHVTATSSGSRSLKVIDTTDLGTDPPTVNRLNGESFQQDALVTFNGKFHEIRYFIL
jgi:hypothetical protein